MEFDKYHALGNDYLVLDPSRGAPALTRAQIRLLCDRHFGVGSDGVLFGPLPGAAAGAIALRIFNPDGSEAEKSGNGLRIFARYLWDTGRVRSRRFAIAVSGGDAMAEVHE